MDLTLQLPNAADDDPAGTPETDAALLAASVSARLRRDKKRERGLQCRIEGGGKIVMRQPGRRADERGGKRGGR